MQLLNGVELGFLVSGSGPPPEFGTLGLGWEPQIRKEYKHLYIYNIILHMVYIYI